MPLLFYTIQTWDLLRVMVYGFRGLVVDFLSSHPGHHINPRHVNGSGVETLFGQLKHTTGGNLTGYNYETAKDLYMAENLKMTIMTLPCILDNQNCNGRFKIM